MFFYHEVTEGNEEFLPPRLNPLRGAPVGAI